MTIKEFCEKFEALDENTNLYLIYYPAGKPIMQEMEIKKKHISSEPMVNINTGMVFHIIFDANVITTKLFRVDNIIELENGDFEIGNQYEGAIIYIGVAEK